MKITFDCAEAIGTQKIEPLTIEFIKPIESKEFTSLAAMADYYYSEGELLAEALMRTLPGGLADALLSSLMRRRASLFTVPHLKETNIDWGP